MRLIEHNGKIMKVKSVTNAKSNEPKSLSAVIKNSLKKTKLNLANLVENNGDITVKLHEIAPYRFERTNVTFNISVPTKKLSFKDGDIRATAATVEFYLIAHECAWHEGLEAWIWDGEQIYTFGTDEAMIHVFPTFKNKATNINSKGNYFQAKGLGFLEDVGVARELIANIVCNTPRDDIKDVVRFALAQRSEEEV